MAGKFPSEFMPARIGATVSQGANVCQGMCGPQHTGQQPHTQPNFRFTLLLFVAVANEGSPANEWPITHPFLGGPFTPPVDVPFMQVARGHGNQLLRMIGWN